MNTTPCLMHVYRVWNPKTREVYATLGAWDETLAERSIRDTAQVNPGSFVQVLRAGEWHPWLRPAEA